MNKKTFTPLEIQRKLFKERKFLRRLFNKSFSKGTAFTPLEISKTLDQKTKSLTGPVRERLSNRAGFTLIELLVVIAIVGLLAAILVPVIGKAREGGRRAGCSSNLQQFGIAWYLYLDDHGDKFPEKQPGDNSTEILFGKTGTETGYDTGAADRPLNPYLDIYSDNDKIALEVVHCPSDRENPTRFDKRGTSYNMNFWLFDNPAVSIKSVTVPYSQLFFMGDTPLGSPPGEITYHGGEHPYSKMNVLFLDGHVKMHDDSADWDSGEVLTVPTP